MSLDASTYPVLSGLPPIATKASTISYRGILFILVSYSSIFVLANFCHAIALRKSLYSANQPFSINYLYNPYWFDQPRLSF